MKSRLIIIIILVVLIFVLKPRKEKTWNDIFWDGAYQDCLGLFSKKQCDCSVKSLKQNYFGKEQRLMDSPDYINILNEEFAKCR